MSESLDVALRISAVGAFDGVLNRLHNRIRGLGGQARQTEADFKSMFGHIMKGVAGIAGAKYALDKTFLPGVKAAGELQASLIGVEQILQGAHPHAKKLADEMARVRRNSIDVASHMKYSATALTEVTRRLLQGGVPLNAILGPRGAAFSVEALAETRGYDPSQAALQVANIGHAFQLRPNQYGKAADLVYRASLTGSGTLEQLFHNLENVSSIAHMSNPNPKMGLSDLKATLVALKAIAPIGEQGGSDLAAVIQTMQGARIRGSKYMKRLGLSYYDKKGQFIGIDAAIERTKAAMAKLPTQQARLEAMGRIFQAGGSKAIEALIMPSMPGVKSYDEMKKAIDEQASLTQAMHTWEKGMNAQLSMLHTTNKTTLATLFNPALSPITHLVKQAGQWSGELGTYASKHPGLQKAATYGTAGLAGAAGLYGVIHLLGAARSGGRVFRSLFGKLGRTAGGIAEGKAIQATTGVQPVFVVNMPGGGAGAGAMGGGRGSALDALIAARRVRTARSFKTLLTSSASLSGGFKTAATKLGLIGAAAAAGYGIGTEIYKHGIKGSKTEKGIYAFWDWESSLLGIGRGATLAAAHKRADQIAKQALRRQAENRAKVDLHLHIDHDGKLRLHRMHSDNADVDASVGTAMGTP